MVTPVREKCKGSTLVDHCCVNVPLMTTDRVIKCAYQLKLNCRASLATYFVCEGYLLSVMKSRMVENAMINHDS